MKVFVASIDNIGHWKKGFHKLDPSDTLIIFASDKQMKEEKNTNILTEIKVNILNVLTFDIPLTEPKLIINCLKEHIPSDSDCYYVGIFYENVVKNNISSFLELSQNSYNINTLNIQGARSIKKDNGKKMDNSNPVMEFDDILGNIEIPNESHTVDLHVNDSSNQSNVENTFHRNDDSNHMTKETTENQQNTKPSNETEDKKKEKPQEGYHDAPKEQKTTKALFENNNDEKKKYEIFYSDVENAKAVLCEKLLERFHLHVCEKCFSDNQIGEDSDGNKVYPFPFESISDLFIMILKCGMFTPEEIEKEKELDLLNRAMESFNHSWNAVHGEDSKLILQLDVFKFLYQEASYYQKLTEFLYEEDLWEYS